ncbi:hypothetical protein ECP03022937_0254 [Escherichia coli P0302293.7]|nr:hypothetical protein ECP03022937_0254 [Escherichia coli P0302293.7]
MQCCTHESQGIILVGCNFCISYFLLKMLSPVIKSLARFLNFTVNDNATMVVTRSACAISLVELVPST